MTVIFLCFCFCLRNIVNGKSKCLSLLSSSDGGRNYLLEIFNIKALIVGFESECGSNQINCRLK